MFSKSAILAFVSAALAADHVVLVGQNNGLTFTPQTVNAAVGDTVTYQFLTQNHTVTSGNPSVGCTPDGKFNSGFVPVAAAGAAAAAAPATSAAAGKKAGKAGRNAIRGLNNIFEERAGKTPTFTVTVKDTQPQTVYCAQAQHCQVGMVMVINPAQTGTKSLAQYQALCAKAQTNTLPNTSAGTGGKLANLQKAAAGGAAAAGTGAAAAGTGAAAVGTGAGAGTTAAAAGTAATAKKGGKKGKKAAGGLAGVLGAAQGKRAAGNKRSTFVY